MDNDTNLKLGVLSRETSLGERQMEKMPSIEEQPPEDRSEANNGLPGTDSKPRGRAGYAHLAEVMNQTQHAMVRKYKDVSLLNLLYLQAEIHHLRTDWEVQVVADAQDTDTQRSLWDYHWLAMANGAANGLEGKRWEAWLKLRERLYEYYAAIEKHERIVGLPCPNNAQRRFVSKYIVDDDMNEGKGRFLSAELRGEEPEAYRERWAEDLVVFEHGAESMDAFARWVVNPVLEAAHHCFLGRGKKTIHEDLEAGLPPNEHKMHGSKPAIPLYQYSATGYTILNRVLNSIMMILLPCASIISLNAVPDANKRVGMICAFSLVCAVGMALCSCASRIEVFAVTAAFMSVQLVFVGQQGGQES